ncbi:PREDICTED: uncharacterized protein LOC106812791 [Priapulus caudatus]|uniref:Uncharacterized protein LOC106812791 n=1 Tax=Priapulus caudatus TaxID=37621 RepID=A0ABM1EJ81_PRICU|nr:PREDICTED: uncharacterized protein LOC106812791 [Priapulus caudatus]
MKRKDGHYHLDLPFRSKEVRPPDNRGQALNRTLSLHRKLVKTPDFHRDYSSYMSNLTEKGYAERVQAEPHDPGREGPKGYIPHHGIYNPSKPGKIHVVFDCSAKVMGLSLNDTLIPGPSGILTNTIVAVLLRFRQQPVGIMGDIEEMFNQVGVSERHRDCLRFFWYPDGELSREPCVYRVKTHPFRAVSSPATAATALRQCALDSKDDFPNTVIDTILNSFYVDDLLKSMEEETAAVGLRKDITSVCSHGGFRLHKWVTNTKSVADSIPPSERASPKPVVIGSDHSTQQAERALGIYWATVGDTFGFKLCIHQGYGIAVFVHLQSTDGQVHCTLLFGKSRVAPIMKVTTPRMELTVASVAVKFVGMITEDMEYNFDRTVYWTDSVSVLHCIANRTSRFHTFVANWVATMQEGFTLDQWRYLPTQNNPADIASRGIISRNKAGVERWLKAPGFLWEPETEWPGVPFAIELPVGDPEVRKTHAALVTPDKGPGVGSCVTLHSVTNARAAVSPRTGAMALSTVARARRRIG